jgi:hypothetical protein
MPMAPRAADHPDHVQLVGHASEFLDQGSPAMT